MERVGWSELVVNVVCAATRCKIEVGEKQQIQRGSAAEGKGTPRSWRAQYLDQICTGGHSLILFQHPSYTILLDFKYF